MDKEQNDHSEIDLPTELSAPATRALIGAGYRQLEQLTEVGEAEIGRLHGMGPKGIRQLRSALEARGLSFADKKNQP